MNLTTELRTLFKPVQPTVNQSSADVMYTEFLPDIKLQSFIYCYWQLQTNQELKEPFNYRVVADGCIDIYFDLRNSDESFVMGFCKKFTEFQLDNTFNYVGVRFLPTMFPQLFKINAKEISNRYEELELVVPELSRFISNYFNDELQSFDIKKLLDDYFISHISKIQFDIDYRLYNAIDIILKNYGVIEINKDLEVAVSSRQLQRLFQYYIGDTAKTFSQVVRFQNILKAKPSKESLKQNKLFYDVGYYDQSHFIKEFKTFYGVTPSKAFGR